MSVVSRARRVGWLLMGLAASWPLHAHAHAQDKARNNNEPSSERMAARRQLIADATTAQTQGHHAEALALALRAGEIQMTPSLQMLIAREQSELGQFAAALGSAELCVRDAERDASMRQREAIIASCRALLDSIRARVGTLTIRVPQPVPQGLVVKVGNDTLSPDLYDLPYPHVGNISITATAPEYTPFQTTFTLAPGERKDVTLDLHPTLSSQTSNTPRGPGAGPWVLVGIGVASLGVGAAMYGMQLAVLAPCTVTGDVAYCDSPAQLATASQAPTYNLVGTITTIAGASITAAGLLWFGIGTATSRRAAPQASMGVGLQSVRVQVTF